MMGTINCTYETPCGWCAKWDKKCDQKIEKKENRYGNLFKPCYDCLYSFVSSPLCNECDIENGFKGFVKIDNTSTANIMCQSDEDHQWECCGISTAGSTYRCKICGEHKSVPIMRPDNVTTSTYYNAETDHSCSECYYEGYGMPHCKDCDESNNFKHFEGWENV